MKRILIGRHPDHPYSIDNFTVSRNHAEIRIENRSITLVDLKSSNGTFVLSGQDKIPVDSAQVKPTDQLYFGDSGPHKVKDILYQLKDETEFYDARGEKGAAAGPGAKTRPGKVKLRCTDCGSIIEALCSICPHCGNVL